MGKTWIQIEVSGGGGIKETIVTETAHAGRSGNGRCNNDWTCQSGHTIVHGILFDTGKAEVKPESAPALEEVVKVLKQDPKMKIYVVGHTDNVGALAGNVDLSNRRAAAVVQMLVSKYGVTADRLQPHGEGPYSAIASNDSEDGRALNRRVELVKQ